MYRTLCSTTFILTNTFVAFIHKILSYKNLSVRFYYFNITLSINNFSHLSRFSMYTQDFETCRKIDVSNIFDLGKKITTRYLGDNYTSLERKQKSTHQLFIDGAPGNDHYVWRPGVMPDIMTGHVRWRVGGATGAPVHILLRHRVKRGGAHLLLSEKASVESIR